MNTNQQQRENEELEDPLVSSAQPSVSGGGASPKNSWMTPEWLLDLVRRVGPIDLDPCTTTDNPTDARRFFTIEEDGLTKGWSGYASIDGLTYVNPPYGRGLMSLWVSKILEEAFGHGVEIIALTRGDTSTAWGRSLLYEAHAVCFPPRIKFRGATGSPNFANTIYYFGMREQRFANVFRDLGPIR